MTMIDWIVFGLVWLLIPLVLMLKSYFDKRWDRVYRETQPDIEKGIKDLEKMFGNGKPNV